MRKMMFMLCLALSIGWASAQTKVTGTVVSSENGEPVIGATVVVKGAASTGTITDADGKFTLTVPTGAKVLVISFIGMTSKEEAIRPNLRVALVPSSQDLDEVMVVAYGTSSKKSFTGSAAVVKGEDLNKRLVSSVSKSLDGNVAGVQSTSGSGQPGSGASVVIRGFGSINASNNPLYVVDGIPYDGNINAINPSDIESMTILKDASAGALYGARGANGVIVITTKKGNQEGDNVKINLKATVGVSSRAIPAYATLNQSQYLETVFQAYKNDQIINKGIDPKLAGAAALTAMSSTTTGMLGVNEQYNPFNFKLADLMDPTTGKVRSDAQLLYNQNWMDEISAKNPLRTEYQLGFNGGGKKTKYTASLSYLKENGLLQTTSFQRYTGRVNIETQAKEWLKYGTNMNYSRNNSNISGATGSATSNVWYSAQFMAPIYPIYNLDANKNIVLSSTGAKSYDYGKSRPAGAQTNFNSVGTLYDDKYTNYSDNLSGRAFLELAANHGIFKGLKFTSHLGLDNQNAYATTYYNPYNGNAAASAGRLTKENGRLFSYTFNQLLTYERKINDHAFDILAAHENYAHKYNYLEGEKTGFPYGGLFELSSGSTISIADSQEDNYRIESYFGRINYNYAEKYYFSGSLRTDGSSRFATERNWGNFWSLGGSWRISKESFLKDKQWIDNITVKASYGSQGNDALLNSAGSPVYYAWQSFYNLGFPNANANGAIVTSVENKNVTWETNKNANFGVEFKLFNRLSGTLEYYNRKTVDMLLYVPMATSLGFDGYYDNVGSMSNKGFEATISGDIFKSNDFNWSITLIGQTIKNKVLKLSTKNEIVYSNTIIREGETLNSFYVVHSAGVDPATGNQLYWFYNKDAQGNKIAGSDYISSNYSQAVNYRVISGSRIPAFQGSINNDFKFKGFDLSFLVTYSIGGKVLDGLYASLMNPMYVGQNYSKDILRAWKNPGDITDVPKVVLSSTVATTDRNLIDASYMALKNVALGYTFKKSVLKQIGVESLRLFASGENLLLLTHLKGMDPQYNFTGSTDYSYVSNRVIAAGIDINF